MSEPRRASLAIPVAVTIAVVLAVYFGSYRLTVTVARTPVDIVKNPVAVLISRHTPSYTHNQRLEAALAVFFSPAHWLDRELRPDVWREDLTPLQLMDDDR